MLKIGAYAAALCLTFVSASLSAEQTSIRYKNTRGSVLELNFGQDNKLTGSFVTAVATKDCQQAVGSKRPIIGYADGTAIGLSINYPVCGSVVTLSGHISKDRDVIETIAVIAHQGDHFGTQYISHDTFARQSQG